MHYFFSLKIVFNAWHFSARKPCAQVGFLVRTRTQAIDSYIKRTTSEGSGKSTCRYYTFSRKMSCFSIVFCARETLRSKIWFDRERQFIFECMNNKFYPTKIFIKLFPRLQKYISDKNLISIMSILQHTIVWYLLTFLDKILMVIEFFCTLSDS